MLEYQLKRLFELSTGISVCGFSNDILKDLVLELRSKLVAMGIPDDKTYASKDVMFGNVSVCRYTQKTNTAFLEKVKELKHIEIGTLKVKTISLITTNAVCYPNKTTNIEKFQLYTPGV